MMARWYVILPGTPVMVRDGAALKPQTLRGPLQFKEPAKMDHKTVTFEDGGRSVVVDRKDVALSDYDGLAGTVQWGT
jgi:hypothetical protein